MATVWRAHDRALDPRCSEAASPPCGSAQPEAGPRFRREALAAAALDHSGVVTVHDVGVDASGPYIVMEFVDGESLSSRLGRLGALPPAEAARIALAVAEALGAHRRGGPSRHQARQHPPRSGRSGAGGGFRDRPPSPG